MDSVYYAKTTKVQKAETPVSCLNRICMRLKSVISDGGQGPSCCIF